MQMPQMNGAQFLGRVREVWPATVRIVLTGYADIGATIAAINQGEIHRYITKPWDDQDLLLQVRQALERKALEEEKQRLEQLTQRQNIELRELNQNLDAKVRERTADLRAALEQLDQAHAELKQNFLASIKVLSNFSDMREGVAGHSRRVANLARKIALYMGLPDKEVQDIFIAGLLHDIGKVGLPDRLLHKAAGLLSSDDQALLRKHPAAGQAVLMSLPSLQDSAQLIRNHHERFDGMGYPDGLRGMEIPLGARILALANDYDAMLNGMMLGKRASGQEAIQFLKGSKNKRYDPVVVEAFWGTLTEKAGQKNAVPELALRADQLVAGMVLSRDIMTPQGVLLLASEHVLTEKLIEQIMAYERSADQPLIIHVLQRR
jgi:response regulator RpfG family c-di-GMP phosphodiesterase